MREVISALALGTALAALLGTYGHSSEMMLRPRDATLAPTCYWCGLYIGLNAGYGGADFEADVNEANDPNSLSAKHSASGVVGGGHIGYNYVLGNFLLGAETDISATTIKQTENGIETKLPWFGTTRLRGGFLLTEYLMGYGSGSVAYRHVKVGDINGGVVITTPAIGWVVGAGVEYALTPNLLLGAEYLHVDLDGPSATAGILTIGTRVPADIGRARLSYKF